MRTLVRFCTLLALLSSLGNASLFAGETSWPAPDWQTARPESQQMSAAGLEKVGQWLKDNGSKTGMVVRHGRIVGEWYFDEATPKTKYLVFSTTKSFSSTAAGLAIEDGQLSLDTKVGTLLPDVKPAEKREVTVRQLISMTTGVHNEPKLRDMPDVFKYALYEAPMDHKPGEVWNYNNTGLAILAPVMHKATGQQIDELLDARVFRPIGITKDDWSWDHREGIPLPYSGLHITARALARFGLMVLNQGRWQEKSIVPAKWLAAAAAPSQTMNQQYGYLWWNNTTGKWPGVPSDAFAALGAQDNDMLIVPSLDMIVIRQVGDLGKPRKVKIGELFKLAVDAAEASNARAQR